MLIHENLGVFFIPGLICILNFNLRSNNPESNHSIEPNPEYFQRGGADNIFPDPDQYFRSGMDQESVPCRTKQNVHLVF